LPQQASGAGITRDASRTICVISLAFPVNVPLLAKNAGDVAYNINGSLICGVGRLVSDDTSRKKIFSDVSY
jgi:hypothetical protein